MRMLSLADARTRIIADEGDPASTEVPTSSRGYRSAIHCFDAKQVDQAKDGWDHCQAQLNARRLARITTELAVAPPFYYAGDYHQQYLAKHPGGYCGLGGCGVPYISEGSPTST